METIAPRGCAPPAAATAHAGGTSTARGGGTSPAPADAPAPVGQPDVAAALEALTGALQQLAGVLAALQGAGQVQGGGAAPTTAAGCGCGSATATGAGGGAMGAPEHEPPASAVMQGPRGAPAAVPMPPAPATSSGDSGGARERIVAAARAELRHDVREDAAPDEDRAGHIRRYRSAVTGAGEDPSRAEPWCADFVSWVLKAAGVPFGDGGRGEDSTRAMMAWAKQQGRWQPRGGADPRPGDLVMIDWGGGGSVNHVAVVVEVSGGRVHTVGGNESDRVKSASYALDDRRIIGYVPPGG